MKVLHFYKTSYPETMGGVEQVIHNLASGSKNFDCEANVLSLSADSHYSEDEINGYKIFRVPRLIEIASTAFSLGVISKFKKLLLEADVIHYHYPWPFMDAVHFLASVKKPTVLTYHSDIIRQKYLFKLYSPLKRKFLRDVDVIVATSPNYLVSSDILCKYQDKVRVIPLGIDANLYTKSSDSVREKWRSSLGNKFFLFVGVLRYYKGLHTLIDAAKGVDFPIVIIGAGPIENALKKQATVLGLRNVHFLGAVSEEDKSALIELCYAMVFPSHLRSEAFGIALLEGAMFCKPLISSEIGTGTSFINIHNETGIVVPPSDSVALRAAMQYLWDHPRKAQTMGKLARARYEKLFTARKMVESYVNLYKEVLGRD